MKTNQQTKNQFPNYLAEIETALRRYLPNADLEAAQTATESVASSSPMPPREPDEGR